MRRSTATILVIRAVMMCKCQSLYNMNSKGMKSVWFPISIYLKTSTWSIHFIKFKEAYFAKIAFSRTWKTMKSRSSSILDHFPNVGLSNIEQIQSKHRRVILIYTSEHLLYVWILLLQHIDDATIGTRHCRDEMS